MLITDIWNNYVMVIVYQAHRTQNYLTLIYADACVGVDVNIDNESLNDYTIYDPFVAVTGEVKIEGFYTRMLRGH